MKSGAGEGHSHGCSPAPFHSQRSRQPIASEAFGGPRANARCAAARRPAQCVRDLGDGSRIVFRYAMIRKHARALARVVPARKSRGLGVLRPAGRLRVTVAAVALAGGSLLAASGSAVPALASTPAPLVITTTSPLTATAGSAYLAKLDASGGTKPYSWSLAGGTSLPAGPRPVRSPARPWVPRAPSTSSPR
jgi:hypothetical protein